MEFIESCLTTIRARRVLVRRKHTAAAAQGAILKLTRAVSMKATVDPSCNAVSLRTIHGRPFHSSTAEADVLRWPFASSETQSLSLSLQCSWI